MTSPTWTGPLQPSRNVMPCIGTVVAEAGAAAHNAAAPAIPVAAMRSRSMTVATLSLISRIARPPRLVVNATMRFSVALENGDDSPTQHGGVARVESGLH